MIPNRQLGLGDLFFETPEYLLYAGGVCWQR